MNLQHVFLIFVILIFYITGGVIDYWQSARHHNKHLPNWLNDWFGIIWLVLYTFLIPGALILIASGDLRLFLLYVGVASIGSVTWDIVYSFLDQQKPISTQIDYFYFRDKNYALNYNQIILWHLVRVIFGIFILVKLL